MGNVESSPSANGGGGKGKDAFASFPGSALVDALNCGGLDDSEDTPRSNHAGGNGTPRKTLSQFFSRMNTEELCAMSPVNSDNGRVNREFVEEYEEFRPRNTMDEQDPIMQSQSKQSRSQSPLTPSGSGYNNSSSQLFAKALVSEVTDNPNTMTPAAMAEREKRLLKAQEKARKLRRNGITSGPRPVGTTGGVGQPSVLGSIAQVLTGNVDAINATAAARNGSIMTTDGRDPKSDINNHTSSVLPPNIMSENRAAQEYNNSAGNTPVGGKYPVTIGLSLSRRSSNGHPDTVTRQTAFDFNELQDRDYKYVSSTDASGWRAGGGERGGTVDHNSVAGVGNDDDVHPLYTSNGISFPSASSSNNPGTPNAHEKHKVAAPDTVHIPIIHIDADSPQAVDAIISALASGEVFIPHMAIIPEALSVIGVSPPDLVVRFGTERNEDLPPDDWPNWCLEFMHNQLYEYFQGMGARWMKRPFSITLARKVRWKTVKHMNRYFAHAERVIDAWREKGPQYLDPQLAYIEGGATPEEVGRPHGIYLLRNDVPTNYFAPNFDPPYTTKMTRSLLSNVLGKSWDKKRREWTSQPIPRLVTPSMIVTAMCGCSDNQGSGFVATEATLPDGQRNSNSTLLPQEGAIRSTSPPETTKIDQKLLNDQSPRGSNDGTIPPPPKTDDSARYYQSITSSSEKVSSTHDARRLSNDEAQRQQAGSETCTAQRIIPHLDLQLSKSWDKSESRSAFSTASPSRYGRPPTPEAVCHRSQVRQLEPFATGDIPSKEEFQIQQHLMQQEEEEKENSNVVRPDVGSNGNYVDNGAIGPKRNFLQPSVSPTKTKKAIHLNRESHTIDDEKKEDPLLSSMASDEDWLDDVGKLIETPKPDPSMEDDFMASLERECQQHMELIVLAQQKTSAQERTPQQLRVVACALEEAVSPSTKSNSPNFRGTQTLGPGSPSHRRSSSSITSSRLRSPTSLRKNDSGTSGLSLEYSVDSTLVGESSLGGSTLNSTVGGSTVGSSLLGQTLAADGSIISSTTREILTSAKEGKMQDVQEANKSGEESQDSEEELIPTDEELYAVGWAKALDPSSESYYYFTLDRSKIVWENPLAPPGVSESQSDDSIQAERIKFQ